MWTGNRGRGKLVSIKEVSWIKEFGLAIVQGILVDARVPRN